MKVLVHAQNEDPGPWIAGIRRWLPDLDAVHLVDDAWPDRLDPAEIDIAIAWKMPHGIYGRLPKLRLIQSMAAGVDHILSDPGRPPEVPVARLVDPWMGRSMTHHVIGMILRWHREFDRFERLRANEEWPTGIVFDPDGTTVGILGMGHLGQAVAQGARAMGFPVLGWSRTPKSVDGVEVLTGSAGLIELAVRSRVLVCLLPLTDETAGILNATLFDRLPRGALLVNVGRGGHLVEADLLAALEDGRIDAAALDVFVEEPLPGGHPFWRHPRVWPTPHIASEINLPTATRAFAETIRAVRAGTPPRGLIDPDRGY